LNCVIKGKSKAIYDHDFYGIMYRQTIETGNCNQTIARWAFNSERKKCEPFYYSGCDGNSNNFESLYECMESCPDAFPPELEVN
jgi:hypothetical protein